MFMKLSQIMDIDDTVTRVFFAATESLNSFGYEEFVSFTVKAMMLINIQIFKHPKSSTRSHILY